MKLDILMLQIWRVTSEQKLQMCNKVLLNHFLVNYELLVKRKIFALLVINM